MKSKAVMKRIGNLYERIISIENLELADQKARRGKLRSYGVRRHDKNREANIMTLQEALKNKTFKTSPYDIFKIHDPKEREIYRLPYYPDRIVHHAIMNILEPIWVSVFTHNTFSCIKGRGISGCSKNVDKIIRKFNGKELYCLKIDIRKFYPSIDHAILKGIVRRKIKCNDTLWLLDQIIDSAPGVPIGNYVSQYFANLFLAYFMHYVNEVLPVEIAHAMGTQQIELYAEEYADDIVFFSDNKDVLHRVFSAIKQYLEGRLALNIKSNYQIFPIAQNRHDKHGRGLDFVGFVTYRNQKLIRKSIKKNFCRTAARLNRKKDLVAKGYKQGICSWLGWAMHSNSRHLLKTIIPERHYKAIVKKRHIKI